MARATPLRTRAHPAANAEIGASKLRDISIHFSGDIYALAVWVARSDAAKSTPACRLGTTLHGLAGKFAHMYGPHFEKPLSSDDVMAIFRTHGFTGNLIIRLDQDITDATDSSETRVQLASRPIEGQ